MVLRLGLLPAHQQQRPCHLSRRNDGSKHLPDGHSRSHKDRILHHHQGNYFGGGVTEPDCDDSAAAKIKIPAESTSIHHGRTPHGSLQNLSPQSRLSAPAIHHMSHQTVVQRPEPHFVVMANSCCPAPHIVRDQSFTPPVGRQTTFYLAISLPCYYRRDLCPGKQLLKGLAPIIVQVFCRASPLIHRHIPITKENPLLLGVCEVNI